jgi:predicted Zn-dependent protease with MMP-like domain
MTSRADRLREAGEDALDAGDFPGARRLLEQAIAAAPDDADARHALALACEALGDRRAMAEQYLAVRKLDIEGDRAAGIGRRAHVDRIAQVATEALGSLPDAWQSRLGHVPILLEPRPSLALVQEGFDPRAYGLFEGPEHIDVDAAPEPTRIVLYTSNLLADFVDEDELCEEVRITVLHEIAHYFGFDEDEMEALGLE